ncbi:Zn-finger domain-containing protein [Mycena amicta]|nr:Zn-finger domain-containing protein [Mycena amicta]
MYRCPYCLSGSFANTSLVNRHIGAKAECRRKREAEHSAALEAPPTAIARNASPLPWSPADDEMRAPIPDTIPAPVTETEARIPPPRGVTVEEVLDQDDPRNAKRYAEIFPGVESFPGREKFVGRSGEKKGKGETIFESIKAEQDAAGLSKHAPFRDGEEHDLAYWLSKNVTQTATDEFLKLKITQDRTKPSFHNNYSFLQKVDQLPTGPEWTHETIDIVGDLVDDETKAPMVETVELWKRDPVECVRELIGNPAFKDRLVYMPERVYSDKSGSDESRVIDEMWSADWWWEAQKRIPAGHIIAPLISASDKTQLTRHQGNKSAWAVYATVANLSKDLRRQASSHATVLIGYIPVAKLECWSEKERSLAGYRLFHDCMRSLWEPLIKAGEEGVDMVCADGFIRTVHPILAAYVADHPERCLVACCKENRCPECIAPFNDRGNGTEYPRRDLADTLKTLDEHKAGLKPPKFNDEGLRAVYKPFWRDLPFSDIFVCFTPDILHQLHNGVFGNHLVKWCQEILGEDEFDARFKAMNTHPGLRHFSNGISSVSQWTGTEHKEMQRVFLGIMAGANWKVLTVVRSLIDFIYYAQLQSHTPTTLRAMKTALETFHSHKHILIELGVRHADHFDIPKLHALSHYVEAIWALGSADGYNTESPERLHIDYAKKAYASSNRRDYYPQMTLWLQRQEAFVKRLSYLAWIDDKLAAELRANQILRAVEATDIVVRTPAAPHIPAVTYSIAKKPSFPDVTVAQIQTVYGAIDFLPAFAVFIKKYFPRPLPPSIYDRFAAYKQLTLHLPPNRYLSDHPRHCRIRTMPAVAAIPSRRKRAVPAHFDTALFIEDPASYQPSAGVEGLRIAQVRCIFMLPPQYGDYMHPLAYIEWFTPFTRFDNTTGMYIVQRSTRTDRATHIQHRNSAVVSVEHLVRPCHLYGKMGKEIDRSWKSDNILDKAKEFFFNPYIDVDTWTRDKLVPR